jgi:prevent-host-death family protein
MKRASVSETKDNLSGLLHEVRQGETVLITHRGEPVARIESCRTDHLTPGDAAAELIRQGVASAPRAPLEVDRILAAELPRLPDGVSASRLVAAERADDR